MEAFSSSLCIMKQAEKVSLSSGRKTLHIVDIQDEQASIRLETFNPHSGKVERCGTVLDHGELIGMLEPLLKYRIRTEA